MKNLQMIRMAQRYMKKQDEVKKKEEAKNNSEPVAAQGRGAVAGGG